MMYNNGQTHEHINHTDTHRISSSRWGLQCSASSTRRYPWGVPAPAPAPAPALATTAVGCADDEAAPEEADAAILSSRRCYEGRRERAVGGGQVNNREGKAENDKPCDDSVQQRGFTCPSRPPRPPGPTLAAKHHNHNHIHNRNRNNIHNHITTISQLYRTYLNQSGQGPHATRLGA